MHLNPYYAALLDYYEDEEELCEELDIRLSDIYTDDDWI